MRVCVCVYAESISVGMRVPACKRVCVCVCVRAVQACVRACNCACVPCKRVCVGLRALDLSKNILKMLPEWLCEALPNLTRLLLSKNRYQE